MIITQPPDAKLPEHLHSYASFSQIQADESSSSLGHFDHYPLLRTTSIADSELPPAYVDPPPQPQQTRQSRFSFFPKKKKKPWGRTRLRRAGFIILAVYCAFTLIFLILYFTGHLVRKHQQRDQFPELGVFAPVLPPGYRPPGAPSTDGYADRCNVWTSQTKTPSKRSASSSTSTSATEYSSHLQYPLIPSNTTSLIKLFIHTGSAAATSGTLTVVSDSTINVPTVEVTMKYRTWVAYNSTSVCVMKTFDQVGLGIYSSNSTASEHPSFDLTLRLPSSVFIDTLRTDLPYFIQNIGHSKDNFGTQFGMLNLGGIFSPVLFNGAGITAKSVQAQMTFSTISGQITTSEYLILRTSQAAIDVNVTLVRSSDDSIPVSLELETENAAIQSVVTVSTTPNTYCADRTTPDFRIEAKSSNAPVTVIVIHDASSSAAKIVVDASTSYAPVVVSLDPLYEGLFSLRSGTGAEVLKDDDIPDYQNMGRTRQVTFNNQNQWSVDGFVNWGYNPNLRYGSANLTTEHAKSILYLKKSCSPTTNSTCPDVLFDL